MCMALVKWLVGFVKIQQRTLVVLNKLSFSNDDEEEEANVAVAVAVAGQMVVNVSFCILNQMSVKRMPIIKPIIKHKIFLYKGRHEQHVVDGDEGDDGTDNVDDDDVVVYEDDKCGLPELTDLNLNILLLLLLISR